MKLEHGGAALKIQSSHDFEQKDFSIKSSAIAFQVLSSGLYQDKIAAVIRELSTNAWDGHRLAELGVKNDDGTWAVAPIPGRTKLPFKVEMPSQWNPVFAVRDYGVGLDHAAVMKLYTTYFGSTKSDSNDFTGALGLGSKSPFSLASSFLVISYYNGTKRTYTAMIGEEGFPSIAKLDEVPTSEENGLEVRVTIDPNQSNMFRDRAAKIYAFFDVPPVIASVNIPKIEYTQRTARWGIRSTRMTGAPTGVIMGQICYPITLAAMEGKIKPHIYSLLQQHSGHIDVFCEMGDVEFQASREALSYTSKTFKFFEDALDDFYEAQRLGIHAALQACKTQREAVIYVRNMTSIQKQIVQPDVAAKKFLFRGKPIHWSDVPGICGTVDADLLYTMQGDPTGKDPSKPFQVFPKFRLMSSWNGSISDPTYVKEVIKTNLKKIKVAYQFPVDTYGGIPRIVYNDQGAPLYRIREHLNQGGGAYGKQFYLIDKKNEDVAKYLAAILEVPYEKISSWNMSVVKLAQAEKIIRIFTPSLSDNVTASNLTTKISDVAALANIKYYMCSVSNAYSFDHYRDMKTPGVTISATDLNKELRTLMRYGILDKANKIAVISKSNEAEFKKLCPKAVHLSTWFDKVKWTDINPENQRNLSALIYRENCRDHRFDYDVNHVIGEYKHFFQFLQKHRDPDLSKWAGLTLNTYEKMAGDIHSKLSRGNRPTEPVQIVKFLADKFNGNLVDFDTEIAQLTVIENKLADTFLVFNLLKELYYNNTSYRYYSIEGSAKQAITSIIDRDMETIKQKLSI